MHVIIVLTFFFFSSASSSFNCINTQEFFLLNHNLTRYFENKTLCGSSWNDLMSIHTFQLVNKEDVYWILTFHQLYTASLNFILINDPMDNISTSLWIMNDMMERNCNISQFTSIPSLFDDTLFTIKEYNQGLNHYKLCHDDGGGGGNTSFDIMTEPSFFVMNENIDFIDDNEIKYLYKIQTIFFILVTILSIFLIIALIYIKILTNLKSNYYLIDKDDIDNTNIRKMKEKMHNNLEEIELEDLDKKDI